MKAAIVLSFSEEVLLVLLASSNNAANSSSILISVSFPPIVTVILLILSISKFVFSFRLLDMDLLALYFWILYKMKKQQVNI